MNLRSTYIAACLALFLVVFAGCDDNHVMECFPNLYRCGGDGGNLLQRCDSTTSRWETLRDCEDRNQVCDLGSCVSPDTADGDADSDGDGDTDGVETGCSNDGQCAEGAVCMENNCIPDDAGHRFDLVAGDTRLIFRSDMGQATIYDHEGQPILDHAIAAIDDGSELATDSATELTVKREALSGLLGQADRLTVRVSDDQGYRFDWRIETESNQGFYRFAVIIKGRDDNPVSVSPLLLADDSDAGLYFGGSNPLILSNGATSADVLASRFNYDLPATSSWYQAILSSEDGSAFLAGAINPVALIPTFKLDRGAGNSLMFSVSADPEVVVSDGTSMTVGQIAVFPAQAGLTDALESYGQLLKAEIGRVKSDTPPSWWSVAGISDSPNEDAVSDLATFLSDELADWGMTRILMDNATSETAFPSGLATLTSKLSGEGFTTGLAMDYLSDSNVEAFSAEAKAAIDTDGFDWLALRVDPAATESDLGAVRDAHAAARDAMTDSAPLLTDAFAAGWGLASTGAISAQNSPVWEPGEGFVAIKDNVRQLAHRYWLSDTAWNNFAGPILFASSADGADSLTFAEARSFATLVALTGNAVVGGDDPENLDTDAINTIRRLLPANGKPAQPLDLGQQEFPEQWHLAMPAKGGRDGYDIVALFDWGTNADLRSNPPEAIPDSGEARTVSFDVREIGISATAPMLAYEFWTGEFLGEFSGRIDVVVPSHSVRVLALQAAGDSPQFIGWNRHILMGGKLVREARFNGVDKTLFIEADVTPATTRAPFTNEMVIYVPETYTYTDTQSGGINLLFSETTFDADSRVLRIRFAPVESGRLNVIVVFD